MTSSPGLSGISQDFAFKDASKLSRRLLVLENVYIFHESFVAWLTVDDGFDRSLDGSLFFVDCRAVHRRLAAACGVRLIGLLGEKNAVASRATRKRSTLVSYFVGLEGAESISRATRP